MVQAVNETQTYFQTVVNKNKESVNQYNNAVRQQWMLVRNYTDGKFDATENTVTKLFGKPYNVEKRIDEIFAKLLDNIGDNQDGFIEYMSKDTFQFSNRSVKQIKENYSNFIKNKRTQNKKI